MENSNNPQSNQTPKNVSIGIYITYVVGAFTGLFWVLALIVSFVYREAVDDNSIERKHLNRQVNIGIKFGLLGIAFWGLFWIITITTFGLGAVIAWILPLAWTIWTLIVVTREFAALVGGREPNG